MGCCCINNTLRADQRERKRKREDEGGCNSRERDGEGDLGEGGLECWRGYSKRDGERKRKTEKQLIRVILVFKRKREQREKYCRERGRDGGD